MRLAFRFKWHEIFEMPCACSARWVGRGHHVAVVVDREAGVRGRTGDAGDLHRAPRVHLAPRRAAAGAGVRRGEDVAGHVANCAEHGRDAGGPFRSPAPTGVATTCQAPAPPFGSVDEKSRPPRAATTQSEGVPQEILRRSSWEPSCVVCHCPATGFVEVRTWPPLALFDPPETAAQKDGDGQEIEIR